MSRDRRLGPPWPIERLKEAFFVDASGVVRHRVDRKAGQRLFLANSIVGGYCTSGYQKAMIGNQRTLLHRVAFAIANDRWPSLFIDHINGNRADNRPENLREVSHRENMQNRESVRSGKRLPGTAYDKSREKWVAQIYVNGTRKFLGYFSNEELAHAAYMTACNMVRRAA